MMGRLTRRSNKADPVAVERNTYWPAKRSATVAIIHITNPVTATCLVLMPSHQITIEVPRKCPGSPRCSFQISCREIIQKKSVNHADREGGETPAPSGGKFPIDFFSDERDPAFQGTAHVAAIGIRVLQGETLHFKDQPKVTLIAPGHRPLPELDDHIIDASPALSKRGDKSLLDTLTDNGHRFCKQRVTRAEVIDQQPCFRTNCRCQRPQREVRHSLAKEIGNGCIQQFIAPGCSRIRHVTHVTCNDCYSQE